MTVKVNQLAAEIMRVVREYTDDVIEGINRAGERLAKEGLQQLRRSGPKHTGEYVKGWQVKREAVPGKITRFVIHNPKHYRLTHLLEHGHIKRGGGRVAPRPHIEPVETQLATAYLQAVEEVVKRGG